MGRHQSIRRIIISMAEKTTYSRVHQRAIRAFPGNRDRKVIYGAHKMIIEDIDALNLHDSELISTTVRTTDSGDENVVLRLNYLIDDDESFEMKTKFLIFVRCWGAHYKMNFRYT